MKFHYYSDTDSLYIDLSENASVDSEEIRPGIVLDFDERGNLVGIDIDRASASVSLTSLTVESLPLSSFAVVGQKAPSLT